MDPYFCETWGSLTFEWFRITKRKIKAGRVKTRAPQIQEKAVVNWSPVVEKLRFNRLRKEESEISI
jgi:ribosomal protein S30